MSRIPPHATCVFKGVIFDIYQWEQELYDGTTTTFEIAKRKDTVLVIALQGDTVFYAQQEQPGKKPFKSLFGGSAEEGEEPLAAAKRELLEETGMVSDNWSLLRQFPSRGKIDHDVYYFVARDCQKTGGQNLDGGEKIEIHHCSLDQFFTDIVSAPDFVELEMTREVFSAFNPEAAEKLKVEIVT